MRPSDRKNNEMRSISFETGVSKHAEGSCLVKFGDTHVLCTASVENRVPPWLRNSGSGWVTAEYGMLPRSTGERMRREASVGKQSGRTQEIQRSNDVQHPGGKARFSTSPGGWGFPSSHLEATKRLLGALRRHLQTNLEHRRV